MDRPLPTGLIGDVQAVAAARHVASFAKKSTRSYIFKSYLLIYIMAE
jgi:hypothetical protein